MSHHSELVQLVCFSISFFTIKYSFFFLLVFHLSGEFGSKQGSNCLNILPEYWTQFGRYCFSAFSASNIISSLAQSSILTLYDKKGRTGLRELSKLVHKHASDPTKSKSDMTWFDNVVLNSYELQSIR